ncbi:MAG TPA: AMIN domain-containing protein [Gemmatimonadaceae bacterium]|jgi:type IV pilus assembly protein PilQ
MIRGMTLVTTALVALGSSAAPARPASATPGAAGHPIAAERDTRGLRESQTPGTSATVISLSIVPTADRAEMLIGVDGPVEVEDFTLGNPDKIVIDITGATLGIPAAEAYDRVTRAGIVNVRYSQYRKNVVRVVLTLEGARPYAVVRGKTEVRVSVEGRSSRLDAWHIGFDVPTSTIAERAAVKADVTESRSATPKVSEPRREPTLGTSRFASMQQRSQQPRITIAWENADIHDVLAAFAAFSGRTIIPAKEVTGNVTAEISNQPWDVAMRAILNANGFDAVEDQNGIIIVDTFVHLLSRQNTEPLSTRTLRLNYARSSSVALMVYERLSRDCSRVTVAGAAPTAAMPNGTPAIQLNPNCPVRGAVTADSLTNSLSITDIPSNLDELESYARSIDLRQPQVNIKAKIILVDRTQLEGLGLRYDLGTQSQFFNQVVPRLDSLGQPLQGAGQIALGGNQISAIANAAARVPSAALQLVYSTAIGGFDFTSFLEALQQVSLLDVQAEPSASVLNNRTANLTAGTQVPIRVIDASSGASNNGAFPRATVRIQETGIILNVTPQVTANGQIQMRVHVENSDVQDLGGDIGAVFPRQSVDNEVLVGDGETAVMGGLTQTTVRLSKSGIPLLVDLPIIGKLFGVTQRTEAKRDLLILITPHIIDDGQQPSDQIRR